MVRTRELTIAGKRTKGKRSFCSILSLLEKGGKGRISICHLPLTSEKRGSVHQYKIHPKTNLGSRKNQGKGGGGRERLSPFRGVCLLWEKCCFAADDPFPGKGKGTPLRSHTCERGEGKGRKKFSHVRVGLDSIWSLRGGEKGDRGGISPAGERKRASTLLRRGAQFREARVFS